MVRVHCCVGAAISDAACLMQLFAAAVRGAAQVVAAGKKKEMMMWEALREATDEEMERDPTVCVMGTCSWCAARAERRCRNSR